MPDVTEVQLNLNPDPTLRTVTVRYRYTVQCNPDECAANTTFIVYCDLVGVDFVDDNRLRTSLDEHSLRCPGGSCLPISTTRRFTVGYSLLREDSVGEDEIRLDVRLISDAGVEVARGSSNVVTGNNFA